MPLTNKGLRMRREMRKEYGKKKGDSVFYAMENAGKTPGLVKKKK